MLTNIILCVMVAVIGFLIGWMLGKRKNQRELNTAVQVVANLKATVEIYKRTNEQQQAHDSQRYTDLKLENYKLYEENQKLKNEL